MEFEDSRMALFPEPNAYIQKCEKNMCEPKKIVFQEPYDCMPAFHINNGFKKGNCDCVPKPKKQDNCQHNQCDCAKNKSNQNSAFDLKSLLPLLGAFNNGSGSNLSSLVNLLNSNSAANSTNLISSLMANKDIMSGVLNLFKGKGKESKPAKKNIETTDFEIKNYTRVE
ncbi:MAG: hypothetical protein IKY10_02915 [Clostridia bacterium]|nr:hypothetical protein [Clostridia bacterium]